MFVEALLLYISSLAGVFLYKFTKEEINNNLNKFFTLKTVLFVIVVVVYFGYKYSEVNLLIMLASSVMLFLINYLPQKNTRWSLDIKSFVDMTIQNIPMGFALTSNTVFFMLAYYIAESSIFSSKKRIKNSLNMSALSMIPFVIGVVINYYYPIPTSITAGLLLFLAIKKIIILKNILGD